MPLKDECNLCGRVFPLYRLKHCQRCGRLYCRDCMTDDVRTGEPDALCLNCARKIVSPRKMGKYEPLRYYLQRRGYFTNLVTLKFAQIDGIIADNLPMKAYKNPTWWVNNSSSLHARAWLEAGWRVEKVDFEEGTVTFRKVRKQLLTYRKKKSGFKPIEKPFKPAPVKLARRRRVPSKTKIAYMYARLKNIERMRSLQRNSIRGKFKPRSALEKRLFKPDKKPSS